jgi:hypothetical protein
VLLCNLTDFRPSATEAARHNGDHITPAVLRITRHFLDRSLDVVLLSRQHDLPREFRYDERTVAAPDSLEGFLKHVQSYLPEKDRGRVSKSTVHGYKGQEQSAVIVVDVVEWRYPLIHPTWVFRRIFGDMLDRLEAEERRLFYVAITRARDCLALVTETPAQSPYLTDISRHIPITHLVWTDIPAVASLDGACVEIRVSNARPVKDQLKQLGYRFVWTGQYWHRAVAAESFSFDALLEQPWASTDVTIKVYSEAGQLLHQR